MVFCINPIVPGFVVYYVNDNHIFLCNDCFWALHRYNHHKPSPGIEHGQTMAHYYCTNLWRRSRNHSLKPSIFTHSKPLKGFVLQHSVIKPKHFRSLVRGIVRGFEWVEILGFTVLIYIVQLNWRWLMMHERSMKKEPWPKSHKWRCFKHFHGFKNRLAWAKTVRIFTKGGTAAAQCSSSAGITNRTARLYRPWQAFHIGAKVLESLGSEFQIIALHCNPACTQPLCIYTQIWTSQQHIKKKD